MTAYNMYHYDQTSSKRQNLQGKDFAIKAKVKDLVWTKEYHIIT